MSQLLGFLGEHLGEHIEGQEYEQQTKSWEPVLNRNLFLDEVTNVSQPMNRCYDMDAMSRRSKMSCACLI
jgi:hypothetical protein